MNPNQSEEFISKNEFEYLADIFNGVLFSAEIPLETQLLSAIDDSDLLTMQKWNVDASTLRAKIIRGYDENRVILVAKILQYWNRMQFHI